MPNVDDLWKLDSGFESEFTLAVDSAYFAPNENFSGNTVLHLVGHKPDGETRTQIYAMGADWVSTDGGNTASHPSGKEIVNKSSNYGHFIEAALRIPGFVDYYHQLGIGPTDARIWNDLVIDLVETEIQRGGVNRRTGEPMQPSRVMLPVAIQFPNQLPLSAAVAPPATPAAAPSAADVLRAAQAKAAAPSTLRDELILLARQHPTHDSFVEAAAQLPGIMEDDDLMSDVVNPQPDGLWASARKEA